jgi:hypothetical protein
MLTEEIPTQIFIDKPISELDYLHHFLINHHDCEREKRSVPNDKPIAEHLPVLPILNTQYIITHGLKLQACTLSSMI